MLFCDKFGEVRFIVLELVVILFLKGELMFIVMFSGCGIEFFCVGMDGMIIDIMFCCFVGMFNGVGIVF